MMVTILTISRNLKDNLKKKENFYSLFLILIIFCLDRYSKNLIITDFLDETFYINDFLNLNLIWNTGIGFGLFSNHSAIIYNFITILIGIIILVLIYICLEVKKIDKIIYCLKIGGAIGNFYDRLIFQAVPDFIDLHHNNFHWFTFNVADIFISIGITTFIIRSFFVKN